MAAALTETWFREEHTEAQVAVEGYTLIRSDRPSRKGGGCALYLNSALTPSDEISWSDQSSNIVAVYIADVHVVIACLYLPPTGFSALDVHGSDFESLTAELCSVDWEDIANNCHEHDCADLVIKITEKVLEVTEKHCKRKRLQKKEGLLNGLTRC